MDRIESEFANNESSLYLDLKRLNRALTMIRWNPISIGWSLELNR